MINHFEPHTTCSTKSISSEHVGLQGRRLRVDSPLLNLRWGTALAYVLQYFGNTYIKGHQDYFGWRNTNLSLKRSFGNLARKVSGHASDMIFPQNPGPSLRL